MTEFTETLCEQALALGASTLFEASACETSNALAAVDPAIRPVWEGAALAGSAFPVECAPGDNLAIQVALEIAPANSVLVVSAQWFIAGYWGEVLTVAARAAGIKGLVIDGGVRDIAALRAQQFPVFARGISVKGTRKSCVPSVGKPMHLCATPVSAGDWVIADDDGVVILPADQAHAILQRGKQREQKEADMMNALREGKTSLALMGLSQWSLR